MKQQTQTNKTEWKEVEIGELLDYEQPGSYIVQSEILKEKTKNSVPVLTANKSFILGYTEEKNGIYNNFPVIIFDDFTTDTKFVDFKFKVKSSAMKLLRPKSKEVNLKFVFLMMKGIQLNFSTHKRYYLSVYQKRKILMPFKENKLDLGEQERIVKILEESEKLNERVKRAEELLDEYLKSVFYEMFGDPINNDRNWQMVQVREIFDMKLGKMLSAKNYTGKNLKPYLRNMNVKWGKLDLSDVKEMDFNKAEFKIYALRKGDILVCEGGEVGRTAIYNGEIKNCCYQNALHRLRVKDNSINPKYFLYFMMLAVKAGLIKTETIQVTIAHFTSEKFKRLKIPLPPLPLQQKFSKIVEQIEKMKDSVNKTKKNSEELFNSLVSKAFRGGL